MKVKFAMTALLACAVTAAAPAWASAPEAAPDLRLEADISERVLKVYRNGSVTETYEIAVGTDEHPTPTGHFEIDLVIWNPAWVPPPDAEWAEEKERKEPGDPDNPMKTAKLFFDHPDYYIHGTGATETLGTAASHGCIRMRQWDVAELAKLVMEHGGESRGQPWYDRVIEKDLHREIRLDHSIPLEIHQ